ncbi:hypothetical protein L1887_21629 [Cichorium endivia]|nr:hypothetical protein L1887_21629 [Cichorium endivia]
MAAMMKRSTSGPHLLNTNQVLALVLVFDYYNLLPVTHNTPKRTKMETKWHEEKGANIFDEATVDWRGRPTDSSKHGGMRAKPTDASKHGRIRASPSTKYQN